LALLLLGAVEEWINGLPNERVLNEHSRLLERLPEAVRDKIRFKGQP
jgi:hypothetical protein